MTKNILITVAVALVVSLGVVSFLGTTKGDNVLGSGLVQMNYTQFVSGISIGNLKQLAFDSTGKISSVIHLDGGTIRSYTNATSTTATTQTLVQADILKYDTVLFTPNTGSVTLTLPATSTLTTFIPTAGDMVEQCWYNATSTASINITFAAGTGIDLQRVATSTVTGAAGVLAIPTGNSACFKFIRQTNTDVQALMTNFIDAD